SSVGMKELPYAKLPFSIYGDHVILHASAPSPQFPHPVLLLSGVTDGNEVMRGEETQVIGIADLLAGLGKTDNTIVVMPGTHSKHVYLQDSHISRIGTYLTGELFAVLSENGLFKTAVEPSAAEND